VTSGSPNDQDVRFAFLVEPPFCYRQPNGAVTGCDVELARHGLGEIAVRSITFVETEFSELLPGLADGRWEMTTGLFVTPARRELADFSQPIWMARDGLLVRADRHDIVGYASLVRTQARLGVVEDQVQHSTALRLGIDQKQIAAFATYSEAAAAVAQGAIDAYASVAAAHRGYLALNPDLPLAVVEIPAREKPSEQGAFAFAKSQGRLRSAVDAALSRFLGSPEHVSLMARFGLSTTG
jgi:polar amino acid transport system substrate-binding protein